MKMKSTATCNDRNECHERNKSQTKIIQLYDFIINIKFKNRQNYSKVLEVRTEVLSLWSTTEGSGNFLFLDLGAIITLYSLCDDSLVCILLIFYICYTST